MIVTIRRWDGKLIQGALSKGASRTFAALDWRELLPGTPGLEIEAKLKSSRQGASAFSHGDHALLCSCDGLYSDLQSINSEDTVTWAAFRGGRSAAWLRAGLEEAFGLTDLPEAWRVHLWLTSKGPVPGRQPEADADISPLQDPGSFRFTVESKWKRDLDDGQGGANWNQLDMRAYVARGEQRLDRRRHGVLVLVPPPEIYPAHPCFGRYFLREGRQFKPTSAADGLPSPWNDRGSETSARVLTWSRVAELAEASGDIELGEYLRWRLGAFSSIEKYLV